MTIYYTCELMWDDLLVKLTQRGANLTGVGKFGAVYIFLQIDSPVRTELNHVYHRFSRMRKGIVDQIMLALTIRFWTKEGEEDENYYLLCM